MKILLYGAGGHAKVIIDCLASENRTVAAIFDDNPTKKSLAGIPVAGIPVAGIPVVSPYQPNVEPHHSLILSIGNNKIRHTLAQSIQHAFASTIHTSALLSASASVQEGTVIFHRAVIQAGVQIGRHAIINTASVVEHDCTLADFVHVAPGAILCGGVQVGEGSLIGAGAVVLPGVSIGTWCIVGAGAVVTRSVPDYSMAVGNPARISMRTNEV